MDEITNLRVPLAPTYGVAVESPVCRDDEHDEVVSALANEGLGPAGQ